MAKSKQPRKLNGNLHALRRRFIGSLISYNGNPDDGQLATFANGRMYTEHDLHFAIKNVFTWKIDMTIQFRNELGFIRTEEHSFKTSPCRFNELSDYAHELTVKAGLGMPEGYKFHREQWRAKIVG